MTENSRVYTGKLPCGFAYEIHQISSFSNRSEIALIVNGEPVFIVAADKKRSGIIEFKPGQSQKITVKPTIEPQDPKATPTPAQTPAIPTC